MEQYIEKKSFLGQKEFVKMFMLLALDRNQKRVQIFTSERK